MWQFSTAALRNMMSNSQWLPVIYIFCMLKDVATGTKEMWNISIKQQEFTVETSRDITIDCRVEYPPPEMSKKDIQGFWKVNREGRISKCERKSNEIIYNHNNTLVWQRFQGRTKALGNIANNNCSLSISNIQNEDQGRYYFRVETGSNSYSFCNNTITIKVKGHVSNVTLKAVSQDVTENPFFSTNIPGTSAPSTDFSIFIYVPIIVLVVVIVAVAVFLLRRRKRRRQPSRQDSSYYVNFRPPCEMQNDGPKLPEKFEKKLEPPPFTSKPQDEPIYSNVQGKTLVEPAASDQMENIYTNVGCGTQW
ncbi:sialoadhesin isoform X1 [Astyanax mexicanus]|uniref:sialoadhesin isoform X1 n=2 Tax=Astyanax mexicanus TaxID=7994 RepID=UPI0020CAB77C|nr:sialoadhesin isoform X1 [Astyanax mexicanus]